MVEQLDGSRENAGSAFDAQFFDFEDRQQHRRPKQDKRAERGRGCATGRVNEVARARER